MNGAAGWWRAPARQAALAGAFGAALLVANPGTAGSGTTSQTAGQARQSLGVFGEWGAFRQGGNCYAIAEALPDPRRREQQPYLTLSVSARGGTVYTRLSRAGRPGSTARLRIGSTSIALSGAGADRWVLDQTGTAQVLAALRTTDRLSVQAVDTRGVAFSDRYSLQGAATAYDTARLACGRAG